MLEALIAFVIVVFGIMAVSKEINGYVVGATQVEEKTLASWIATNKLTEISVGPTWPQVGDYDEDVEFAGRQWRCQVVVSETEVENLHRVDVSVLLLSDPARPMFFVYKVSALVEPPAPPGFLSPQWSLPQRGAEGGGGRG